MDKTDQGAYVTIHIRLPKKTLHGVDCFAGRRKRSHFFTSTANHELKRLRLAKALERTAGICKDNPLFQQGGLSYQKKLRKEGEVRFRKQWIG